MPSSLVTRSIRIGDRQVEVCIERLFWTSLEEIATARATTMSKLVASIGPGRSGADLSSIVRSYVLDHFQAQSRRLDDAADTRGAAPADDGAAARPRWFN